MPPLPPSRQSLYPAQQSQQPQQSSQQPAQSTSNATMSSASASSSTMSANKARQYAHLHSQLAQLNAHLADTENLVRMTAIQSGDIRFLGGYVGAMLMGSAKILGEDSIRSKEEAAAAQDSTVQETGTPA